MLERSEQRVLRADGTTLELTPRQFSALLLFVEQAGRLLDKGALMQALWPGLVVEENNLSQAVSGLRRALGHDRQGGRFIQTVPKCGFRFTAPVTVLAELASPSAAERSPGRTATAGLASVAEGSRWAGQRQPQAAVVGPAMTLAVLPFRPLMIDDRDDLLDVGMADSLVARLSIVPGLVVRSTGSVLRYKGSEQDPMRAAQELSVNWIVDGTLQRRGDQLRATARLLHALDGTAAWSGSFDQRLVGVFDVQDQIAAKVTQALAPLLQAGAGATSRPSDLGGTHSAEAYQLYLAASWRSQSGRADDIDRAIDLLHKSLAIDPGHALAWTELAWVHRRRVWNADALPADVVQPINVALQRALTLAPHLAQARAGLGFSRSWFEFDWPGAEQEFRCALSANPNVAAAHWGLAQLLLPQGRIDEGFQHMRMARELDPMSPLFNTLEASFLVDRGCLAEARVRLDRAFDITDELWLGHVALGQLRMAEGQPAQAIDALRRAVELAHEGTRPQAVLAMHLAALGQADEARSLLQCLLQRAQLRFVPPTSLAMVHAALGDIRPALAALEQAYIVRDARLIYLKDDPAWTVLRGEPRYQALLQRLGLDRFGPGLTPV